LLSEASYSYFITAAAQTLGLSVTVKHHRMKKKHLQILTGVFVF
jgi:hypothetical protein